MRLVLRNNLGLRWKNCHSHSLRLVNLEVTCRDKVYNPINRIKIRLLVYFSYGSINFRGKELNKKWDKWDKKSCLPVPLASLITCVDRSTIA